MSIVLGDALLLTWFLKIIRDFFANSTMKAMIAIVCWSTQRKVRHQSLATHLRSGIRTVGYFFLQAFSINSTQSHQVSRITAFILILCECRVITTGFWLACAISALQLATIPVMTAVIQTRPTAQQKHVQSGLQLAMFAEPILSSIAYTLVVLCSWDAQLKAAFGDIVAMLSAGCAVCKRCMTKVRCLLGL